MGIIWVATITIFIDAYQVKRYSCLQLYTSSGKSAGLLVTFIYVILLGGIISSTTSFLWALCTLYEQPTKPTTNGTHSNELNRGLLVDEAPREDAFLVCSLPNDERRR